MFERVLKNPIKRFSAMVLAVVCLAAAGLASAAGGEFVDKQYSVDGGWSLEQRGDTWVVTLDESFKTKSGPDLKIFLSPQTIEAVTGKTATDGAVLVSPLENNTGAQEYVLPADVDPANFTSLLIHCEQFSVLWGGANL